MNHKSHVPHARYWRIRDLTKPGAAAIGVWLLTAGTVSAQTLSEQIRDGFKSSFNLPFEEFAQGEHDSIARNVLDDFSVNASFNYPLYSSTNDLNETGHNSSLDLGIRYNPLSSWFVGLKFSNYLNEELQTDSDPDFEYSFGYDDWRPWTMSLVYENSAGNRFNPDRPLGQKTSDFNQGTWTLGWKVRPSDKIQERLRFDDTSSLDCKLGLTITPKYFRASTSSQDRWQRYSSFGCKYTVYKRWYVSLEARLYGSDQQNPWNPDFTWGFGYFDWRPGKISVAYFNDAGNRFPWSGDDQGTTRFKDGTISVFWSWQF